MLLTKSTDMISYHTIIYNFKDSYFLIRAWCSYVLVKEAIISFKVLLVRRG